MAIGDVYKNPTVKQVIFQIVFPNYFSMETKIGDYQLEIMDRFPKSSLLIQNQFLFAQKITDKSLTPGSFDKGVQAKKIWQFKTEKEDVTLNVSMDSLDISSEKHKTYNNKGSESKFRDTISFVVDSFFKKIPLIRINKIGLRYMDECPLPEQLSTASFLDYYNSFINFSNVGDIKDVSEMDFGIVFKNEEVNIIYRESLQKINDNYKYSLDFDGQVINIAAKDYIEKLDSIHNKITSYYHTIIKEPVIKIMNS